MSASICTHISGEVKENDDTQIWLDGTVAASAVQEGGHISKTGWAIKYEMPIVPVHGKITI